MSGRLVNSGDRDDPLNYVDFDSYCAGAARPWKLETLAERWNKAHPPMPVIAQGTSSGSQNVTPITPSESCGVTRALAALQLVGGGIEVLIGGGALLAPEPTMATKVVGAVVIAHGIDGIQSSLRGIVTCNRTATFTQLGASAAAEKMGASPATAETIGVVTDVGVGFAGSFGVGALSKTPAGATRLVHLTNANSAAAIRASETLGLGKSTIYAGPEALAKAKGWSIIAKTGLRPSQASEAILLPSKAGESFLVVTPIGPFSAWQRLNGTVFSAGAGSLNLTTGVFTRSGLAINQLSIYALDAAVVASMRAAPELDTTQNYSKSPRLYSSSVGP